MLKAILGVCAIAAAAGAAGYALRKYEEGEYWENEDYCNDDVTCCCHHDDDNNDNDTDTSDDNAVSDMSDVPIDNSSETMEKASDVSEL